MLENEHYQATGHSPIVPYRHCSYIVVSQGPKSNNDACEKKQVALKRHYDRYLWERSANHVKEEWERARTEEVEAAKREYEAWLVQEVSRPRKAAMSRKMPHLTFGN